MNFDAPEEHAPLRASVRRFFEAELPETRIREMDRARRIPRELWRRMAALGWLGLGVPEAYGGSGGDVGTGVVLCEELARRFPSLAVDWVLLSMTARAFVEHGTAEQKAEYPAPAGPGRIPDGLRHDGAFGRHRHFGPDDRAELVGGEWRIRGQKLYTSLADDADAILVLCRTDAAPAGKRARGLSLLVTPRRQEGVTVRRLELMAMRAACTCEVFLDEARAPGDGVLGGRGRGWYHLLSSLDEERTLAAAIYVGITRRRST